MENNNQENQYNKKIVNKSEEESTEIKGEPDHKEKDHEEEEDQEEEDHEEEDHHLNPTEYNEASIAEQKNRIQILMEDKAICSLRQNTTEDENNPTIKKIQLQTPLVDYEWEISQKIQQIPHTRLYFSTIIEPPTPIQIGSITEDNIEKCENKPQAIRSPEESPKESQQLVSTTYKRRESILLQQYIFQLKQSDSEYIFMTILDTFLQLLYALKKLQILENPIILFDIHPNTIFYDENPFFMDHRIAIEQQDLLSKEKRHDIIPHYDIPYSTTAIEIWLLSNIIEEHENQPFDQEKLKTWIMKYQQQQEPFMTEYQTYLQQFQSWDILEEELIKTANTWDLYALAIIYKQLSSNLKLHELRIQIDETPKYPFLEEWYEILELILYTIPSNRPTIDQIIEKIESSFKTVDKELYQSFLLEFLS